MNQIKRLERRLSERVSDNLNEEEQRNFISEKAKAIERYLTCEPQEENEALEEVYNINKKYGINHNSTLPTHLRHYLD